MLTTVRNAIKGWVAYLIVGVVIIAFGVFGVPELSKITQKPALTVGNENISMAQIDREFKQEMKRQETETGVFLSQGQAVEQGLLDASIRKLSMRTLLDNEATKIGLGSTDKQVRDYIDSIPNLKNQITGKIDNASLARLLQTYGLTMKMFEADVKSDLKRNQLISALTAPQPAPKSLVRAMLLRQSEERRITAVTIPLSVVGVVPVPSDQQIADYYQQNISRFATPEYRTFNVAIIRPADFSDGMVMSEEEIEQLYALRKDDLSSPERRTVRRLTYQTLDQAEGAIARLQAGTSFEELAQEKSFNLDSVTFLDAVPEDINDKALADALFTMPEPGVLATPIKGTFGYTVAETVSIIPAVETSIDQQRETLRQELLLEDTSRKMFETVDAVEELLDSGTPLAEALQTAAGRTMRQYGPVDSTLMTPGGAIVDDLPTDILEEAYLMQEGDETPSIQLQGEEGFFFVSLQSVVAPAQKPLSDVQATVISLWRNQQSSQLLNTASAEFQSRLAAGDDMAQTAETLGYDVNEMTISRGTPVDGLPPRLLDTVFNANLGGIVSERRQQGDAVVVARVESVVYPPMLQGEALIGLYQNAFGAQLSDEAFQAYLNTAENEEGIKINQTMISNAYASQSDQ